MVKSRDVFLYINDDHPNVEPGWLYQSLIVWAALQEERFARVTENLWVQTKGYNPLKPVQPWKELFSFQGLFHGA